MKPLQQHFYMVIFIQYVVLTFEPIDEIIWCDHSSESTSSAVLSHGTIYLDVILTLGSVCQKSLMVLPFRWNLFSSNFHMVVFIEYMYVYLALTSYTSESVDKPFGMKPFGRTFA